MTRTRAVIVAHGQPGDPESQELAIHELAAKIGPLIPECDVRGATLAAPNALSDAVKSSALIYPLFMASGWFTKTELRRRLALTGATDLTVLPPFGDDPLLPDLCLKILGDCARQQGWDLARTGVVLTGHGSGRSRAPAQAVQDLADILRPHTGRLACGFIEEEPLIETAAQGFGTMSICLPFFATRAGHVIEDMPQALAKAGFKGQLLPPVGLAPDVPAMIAASLSRALHHRKQGRD